MPVKSVLAGLIFIAGACSSVKYNSHVGPDGQNGYLRTYYSSGKEKANGRTEGTGIEQCKVQGSDVICKDLNIIHADVISNQPAAPVAETKPAPAKVEATPAKPAAPVPPAPAAKPAAPAKK